MIGRMRVTMNISLPEAMKVWVEEQVRAGSYETASEFFRQLIREKQQRQLREQIDAKLIASLDSGAPEPITPEFWESVRRRGIARAEELRPIRMTRHDASHRTKTRS